MGEITVTGEVDLVKVVSTLHHAVKEMERIGEHVRDEAERTEIKFGKLLEQITCLDKRVSVNDREMKIRVGSYSAVVSLVVAVLAALLKAGVF
jgi:hypothetical protein